MQTRYPSPSLLTSSPLRYFQYVCENVICKAAINLMGPAFVSLGMGLVATVGYQCLFSDEPLVPRSYTIFERLVILSPGLWCLFNLYFNLVFCINTSPGFSPKFPPTTFLANSKNHDSESYDKKTVDSLQYQTCHKCDHFKAPRAHHCSI